jgi:HK97 family phage major capsid protein
MKHSNIFAPRLRGIVAVRADSSNPQALIEQINRAFNDFREQNDRRLADLERGREDVVTNEHVERINASITDLTNALNTQREQIDALRIGGGGERGLSADAQAHASAFDRWFRRGEGEQALGDLQVRAALTSQSEPDGGFLVPEEMDRTISRVLGLMSAMRSIARVVSIGSREYSTMVSKGGAGGG